MTPNGAGKEWAVHVCILALSLFVLGTISACHKATPTSLENMSSNGQKWTADGVITVGEYPNVHVYDGGNYEIHWMKDASNIYIGLKVKTTGWVAVGLGATQGMANADLLIGKVSAGKSAVSDQYSTGINGPHKPDTELGGTDNILEFAGSEANGITIIELKRLLRTGDNFDFAITTLPVNIIWSYGLTDEIETKHVSRGYGKMDIISSSVAEARMAFFDTMTSARILFISGLVNFLFGFIIFASCRWIPVARLTKGWMKNGFFKFVYKYHPYLWWVFWVSVIGHVIIAIGRLGIPF